MTQYIHDLIHLSTVRLGKSSIQARGASEIQSGDIVDDLIKLRVIHEKSRNLSTKMRYRIDKLVSAASGAQEEQDSVDPLAFKPNPSALLNKNARDDNDGEEEEENDGVYRPPKLAAVPYTDPEKTKKDKKKVIPAAILPELVGGNEVTMQSSSGLADVPSKLSSRRARELQHMQDYEEENFTRLVQNRKDSNRRLRDEADIALGGSGVMRGRRVGGLDGEFDDVLRAVDSRPSKSKNGRAGIYDELDKLSKKSSALDKASAKRARGETANTIESASNKRGRFDRQVGDAARKSRKKNK